MAAGNARISVFLHTLDYGGVPFSMMALANELAARGYHAEIVVLHGGGPSEHRVSDAVRVVDLNCSRALFALPALRRYMVEAKPDVLISAQFHINAVAIAASLLLPSRRIRVIASQHSAMTLSSRDSDRWLTTTTPWLAKLAYRLPDHLVCVSEGVRNEMIQELGVSPKRAVTIHNPIVTHDAMSQLRESPALPPFGGSDEPLIVTAGRLSPEKDLETLFLALAELRRHRSARLLVLGDGPAREGLERLARALGIQDSVHFAGFVDRPLGYMRQAQLFVLSSIYEGFGNVLAEALLCGLPVVSTDCDFGPREILGAGRWGHLVPIRDPHALAEAMQLALASPPPPERQKQRALEFTDERSADRYEELFSEAVQRELETGLTAR